MYKKIQVFPGNSNQRDIIKNNLREFASAKFIRFQPTAYYNWKALMVEVYGILLTKGIYLLLLRRIEVTITNYLWKLKELKSKRQWVKSILQCRLIEPWLSENDCNSLTADQWRFNFYRSLNISLTSLRSFRVYFHQTKLC